MRQRELDEENVLFRSFLRRLRRQVVSEEDLARFRRDRAGVSVPLSVLRAFDLNRRCDAHNWCCFRLGANRRTDPIFRFVAGGEQRQAKCSVPEVLHLRRGLPVLPCANLGTPLGLVNGTRGVLREVWYTPEQVQSGALAGRLPECIIVEIPAFTGPAFFADAARRHWVPVQPHDSYDDGKGVRRQLPVIAASALTVHKSQGSTLPSFSLGIEKMWSTHRLLYVGLSRGSNYRQVFWEGTPLTQELVLSAFPSPLAVAARAFAAHAATAASLFRPGTGFLDQFLLACSPRAAFAERPGCWPLWLQQFHRQLLQRQLAQTRRFHEQDTAKPASPPVAPPLLQMTAAGQRSWDVRKLTEPLRRTLLAGRRVIYRSRGMPGVKVFARIAEVTSPTKDSLRLLRSPRKLAGLSLGARIRE